MQKINRPIAFIIAASNHGTLIVNRNDYRQVGDTAYGVGHQILTQSSFDPNEINNIINLLTLRKTHFGTGVVAIDCGANIGVHTIEMAKHMFSWGSVLAFEAQERIYYALAGNIAINNCFNAKATLAAIGKENGNINIPEPNYNVPSSFGSLELIKKESNEFIGQQIDYVNNTNSIKLINLDSLKLNRVDLIKLDIEGMEEDALHGAKNTLKNNKPIIVVEHIKSNNDHITYILKSLNYQIFPFGINLLAIHHDDPSIKSVSVS